MYTQYKHWKRKHIPSMFAFKTKKLTNDRFVSYLRCYPISVFVKIIALTTCANQLDNKYNYISCRINCHVPKTREYRITNFYGIVNWTWKCRDNIFIWQERERLCLKGFLNQSRTSKRGLASFSVTKDMKILILLRTSPSSFWNKGIIYYRSSYHDPYDCPSTSYFIERILWQVKQWQNKKNIKSINVFACWKVIHALYVERKNPEQEKFIHK